MGNFKVGDRIGIINAQKLRYSKDGGHSVEYGVITDILASGKVMVQWDRTAWDSKSHSYKKIDEKVADPKKLLLENELIEQCATLEKEFKLVEMEVKDKLKAAGQIILDAQKMAKDAGYNLQELYDAVYPLETAMEKAGWQTSSWHC